MGKQVCIRRLSELEIASPSEYLNLVEVGGGKLTWIQ
jgi:hypothetical protein